MAASGLRSLRYAREVEGIGKIVALDIDKGTLFNRPCVTMFYLFLFLLTMKAIDDIFSLFQ